MIDMAGIWNKGLGMLSIRWSSRSLLKVGAVVIGCAALVAGCSTGGEPVAAPSSSQSIVGPAGTATVPASANPYPVDKLWNMEETLPKSRLSGEFGLSTVQPICSTIANSYSCGWSSRIDGTRGYNALALTSTLSFEEIKTRPNFHDFAPVTVGGQEAVRFTANADTLSTLCYIGWGTSYGSIWAGISSFAPADNCTPATRFAEMVHEYAPR